MLHLQLIKETDGSDGVRDFNLLDSALETPFQSFGGDELYPTIQAKAARLGYGLIKNCSMIDSNRRIGTHGKVYDRNKEKQARRRTDRKLSDEFDAGFLY